MTVNASTGWIKADCTCSAPPLRWWGRHSEALSVLRLWRNSHVTPACRPSEGRWERD